MATSGVIIQMDLNLNSMEITMHSNVDEMVKKKVAALRRLNCQVGNVCDMGTIVITKPAMLAENKQNHDANIITGFGAV